GVDPVGHELLIEGRPFLIVGIAKTIGTALGQSQDNFAYIPIQTYFKMYGTNDTIWLNIQARGAEWMEQTQDEARAMMRARRHLGRRRLRNSGPHNRNHVRTYERTHCCRVARGADLRRRWRFLWRLSGAAGGKPAAHRSLAPGIVKAMEITMSMNIGENAR